MRRKKGDRQCLGAHLEGLLLGQLKALGEHARVYALAVVSLSLLEQLANDEHGGRGPVAGDVVLGC